MGVFFWLANPNWGTLNKVTGPYQYDLYMGLCNKMWIPFSRNVCTGLINLLKIEKVFGLPKENLAPK